MTTPVRQHVLAYLQRRSGAALLLALAMLPGCSNLALTQDAAAPSEPSPAFNKIVADRLKVAFKSQPTYSTYEISNARWVNHPVKGWSWLVCVRFQDSGHPRSYAVFIKDNVIAAERFAVQVDGCALQNYLPFDLMSGATGGVGLQDPLY